MHPSIRGSYRALQPIRHLFDDGGEAPRQRFLSLVKVDVESRRRDAAKSETGIVAVGR